MTWEEATKLLKITIRQEEAFLGNIVVKVDIPVFNKKAQYMFSQDLVESNRLMGMNLDTIIKKRLIHDLQLKSWLGEEITIN